MKSTRCYNLTHNRLVHALLRAPQALCHSIISTRVHDDRLRHMPQSPGSLELVRFNPECDIHKAPVRHDLSHVLRLHLVRCERLPMLAPKRSGHAPEARHKLGRPSSPTCCDSAPPQSYLVGSGMTQQPLLTHVPILPYSHRPNIMPLPRLLLHVSHVRRM